MKVFVSLKALRGDDVLESLANQVRDVIRECGHEPFIAPQQIVDKGLTDPRDFMPFIRQQAETCDLMVVIYHPELRGGLIELGIAFANHIPVWVCHRWEEKLSSSALGCADFMIGYETLEELILNLTDRLREFSRKNN